MFMWPSGPLDFRIHFASKPDHLAARRAWERFEATSGVAKSFDFELAAVSREPKKKGFLNGLMLHICHIAIPLGYRTWPQLLVHLVLKEPGSCLCVMTFSAHTLRRWTW